MFACALAAGAAMLAIGSVKQSVALASKRPLRAHTAGAASLPERTQVVTPVPIKVPPVVARPEAPHRASHKPYATRKRDRQRPDSARRFALGAAGVCGGMIVTANPLSGTEDARQPHPVTAGSELVPALRQGIGSEAEPIVLTTTQPDMAADCFVLCETQPDPILGANGIASVLQTGAGTYEIVLDFAIAPNSWTTIAIDGCAGAGCFVEYLANPGNVDHNSTTGPLDILAIIDYINGVLTPPFGIYSSDVDHSGQLNPGDILAVVNLLNGADAFSPQQGVVRPENDSCPETPEELNDECAMARPLTCGGSDTVFISDGYTSDELNDPTSSCELGGGGPFVHDASWWYEFTVPENIASVTVSMCSTADNEDAVITLFTAESTCEDLGELACDDDSCVPPGEFGPSELSAPVVPGESHLVLVDRYDGGDSTNGPYTITLTCQVNVPSGACCTDGQCTQVSQLACQSSGGVFQGADTTCGTVECPQPSGNDECATATPITCGESDTVQAGDFTSNPLGDPTSSCELSGGGPFAHDVSWWYLFTAPQGFSEVTISLCDTPDIEDPVLTLFTSASTCTSLTELTCDDDLCVPAGQFGPPELTAPIIAGQDYLVLVDRYSGGTSTDGPYTISFTCSTGGEPGACCNPAGCVDGVGEALCETGGGIFQGPGTTCDDVECPDLSNDDCAGAFPIFDGVTEFSTQAATTDGPPLPPTCNEGFGTSFGQDIWYHYTSTCTGEVTFSTCNTANFDTRLALYQGCDTCPPEPLVACNDDGEDCDLFTSELLTDVTEGQCYALRIGGFGLASGSGTILVECAGTNAACMGGSGDCCTVHGTAGCSDQSCCATVCNLDSFCCEVEWDESCADFANDVCQVCGQPGACCTEGACADGQTEEACMTGGGQFQGEGTTCAQTECPDLSNDECDGARPIACGETDTIFISDGYTSAGAADPSSTCELDNGGPFAHDASWWYVFTAPPGVSSVTVSMCQTADSEDVVVTMFTAASSCAALTQLDCDDDSCAPGFSPSEFTTSVVAGQTYLILVDRYTGGDSTDGPYTMEMICP
jgi:hypothetical protein